MKTLNRITTPLAIISLSLIVSCQGESDSSNAKNTVQSDSASQSVQINTPTSKTTSKKKPLVCTREYAPVCAKEQIKDKVVFNTYSNDCVMKGSAQGKILATTQGECKKISEKPTVDKNPLVCTMQYDPICAKEQIKGKIVFNTYSNDCVMKGSAQGKIITTTQGECKKTSEKPTVDKKPLVCTMQYNPVCAKEQIKDKVVFNTYSNDCVMNSTAQGKILATTQGECNKTSKKPVVCTREYNPVCAKESFNGVTIFNTYPSSCVMKSNAKGEIVSSTQGECNNKPIACTREYDPVCVTENINGKTVSNTYGNSCMAKGSKGHVVNITMGACKK